MARSESRRGKHQARSLEEDVMLLLGRGDFRTGRAVRAVERLGRHHGSVFYGELIWALAHLRFDEPEAHKHWARIVAIKDVLTRKLGTPVDLRVALVSYFVDVNRKLKSPTIIELKLLRQTQASVYRDELTGLYNYRYLREAMVREVARADRDAGTVSIAMFDLDNFKKLNDSEGHTAGNKVLSAVGRIMSSGVRKVDVAARYGGEEFAIMLPGTGKATAHRMAERIRRRIAEQVKRPGGGAVTVSGGVATHPGDGLDLDTLLQAADQAMYVAKSRGKNQVVLFGGDRRSYKRISLGIDGQYRGLSARFQPFRGIDISEGGMLVRTSERLPMASVVDLQITLPGYSNAMNCVGRVVRVQPYSTHVEMGLLFVNLPNQSRRRLMKFLRSRPVPRRRR